MTPNTRKAVIAKLHIAQVQLGMDDDSYRAILVVYGGHQVVEGKKPSSLGLDDFGLLNVLDRMKELGFTPSRPAKAGREVGGAASKQALLGKVGAYLAESGKSTAYADGMAKRMYKVDRLEWLGHRQLIGIVTALEKAAQKAGRATA